MTDEVCHMRPVKNYIKSTWKKKTTLTGTKKYKERKKSVNKKKLGR